MEREGKAAGSRVTAAHVGCCVCCVLCFVAVFCVGEQLLATILVESQHRPRQNSQLLCNHTIKSAPKDPKYESDNIVVMFRRLCCCFDLFMNVSMGCATSAQKACKNLAR
jgi:hypothetical protein